MLRIFLISTMCSMIAFSFEWAPKYKTMIVNGDIVKESDPVAKSTILLIGKIGRGSFTCSGVLIQRDIILTAGHCLGAPGWAQLEAHFKTDKQKKGPVIPVIKQLRPWAKQPFERPFDQDDIAVLKLKTAAPANYETATLLIDPSVIKNGMTLIQAGYGRNIIRDSFMSKSGVGVLRQKAQIVLNAQYGQREFLMSIVAGGTCSGDSGGPAYVPLNGKLYLAGIASRMTTNNRVMENGKEEYYCTHDMIFTFVPTLIKWITDNSAAMN